MRKSAAPSLHGQSAKRQKFCTPFSSTNNQKDLSNKGSSKFHAPFKGTSTKDEKDSHFVENSTSDVSKNVKETPEDTEMYEE